MGKRGAGVIGFCVVLASLAAGCGANDKGKSYLIRHAGVTLAQAATLAEAQVPGRAVQVELLYSGRQVVYQVEVLDAANESRMVTIDAETGRLLN